MQKNIWHYLVGLFLMVGLTGCIPPKTDKNFEQTLKKVEEARIHVETTERMKAGYYNDFLLAQNELNNAENNLERRKLPEAYLSAIRSIEASKKILQEFYLDTVTTLVKKAKTEIEDTTEKDPDNPLKDFLPELDKMLDYAEEIQTNPQAVDMLKIIDYLGIATQITDNIKANTRLTLDSDISFEQGKYDLSDQGRIALQGLAKKVVTIKDDYVQQFPDATVTIRIKSVGYTDEVGFREGTNLVKDLIRGFEDTVPERGVERRRFLNQRLSTFRAKTLNDYFKHLTLQTGKDTSNVVIEQDIIGKGEEMPPGVPEPHLQNDPRRRICKIYSYVIAR